MVPSCEFCVNDGTWGRWLYRSYEYRMIFDAVNLANVRDTDTHRRRTMLEAVFHMADTHATGNYRLHNNDPHCIQLYVSDDAWLVNARLSGDYNKLFVDLVRVESLK